MEAEVELKALISKYSKRPKVTFNDEDLTKMVSYPHPIIMILTSAS